MKLTRHNGRSGKNGTYNPRHNDRRFDLENSDHIDAERARQNVYWDCYRGFTTHEFRANPEQPDFSFEEIERMYYYEHYGDHVDAQNARNEKTRHLQERLYRMFGTESADNLHFSVSASQIGKGLDEQLQGFITEHPDTKLIIIDTLQKVREVGGDNYSYANDYGIIKRIKKFTDRYGICVLIVHHTRKQTADDKFDMISGTMALLGAADGGFVLQKEKRTSNNATLEVSGRDQPDQKLHLVRNTETLLWELERVETELWKEPPEPLLEKVAAFIQ